MSKSSITEGADGAQFVTPALLDAIAALARGSPRRRRNYNFHTAESDASHRLLNAMEPDSYIPPHCHLDPAKGETIAVLRGKIGVVIFDVAGNATARAVLSPGGEAMAVNILPGVFHTLVAFESGSVFLEAKAGPYAALGAAEKAPWAPPEDDAAAGEFLARLKRLFG